MSFLLQTKKPVDVEFPLSMLPFRLGTSDNTYVKLSETHITRTRTVPLFIQQEIREALSRMKIPSIEEYLSFSLTEGSLKSDGSRVLIISEPPIFESVVNEYIYRTKLISNEIIRGEISSTGTEYYIDVINEYLKPFRTLIEKNVITLKLRSYLYFLVRNLTGLNFLTTINSIPDDIEIEDIRIKKLEYPLILNTNQGSVMTNVQFTETVYGYPSYQFLTTLFQKLAEEHGKVFNEIQPISEFTYYFNRTSWRVSVNNREVSTDLFSTTIRKVGKLVPLTILDIVCTKEFVGRKLSLDFTSTCTVPSIFGAILLYALRELRTIGIIGTTGSGKTTTLMAIASGLPKLDILVIEEVPEIRLPIETVEYLNERSGFRKTETDITLEQLLKASKRKRPAIIIIGELRDKFDFTVFLRDALNAGSAGMFTSHAPNTRGFIARLLSYGFDPSAIASIPFVALMTHYPSRKMRRLSELMIVTVQKTKEKAIPKVTYTNLFRYDKETDTYTLSFKNESEMLKFVASTVFEDSDISKTMENIEKLKDFLSTKAEFIRKQAFIPIQEKRKIIEEFYKTTTF